MSKIVLTVDDSPTMRAMLQATLAEAGLEVIAAGDGLAGIAALDAPRLDVIITDINMPRLDGYGFIRAVRRHPRHGGAPVLVLTTESGPEHKARARQAGATGWIVKPFQPAGLLAAIARVAP